jgi:ADP-heptose:LPS heptosyltransferase
VVNNDLDFSLRLGRGGRRVVYTPHATMIHHEMVSRSELKDVYNSAHFDAAWKDLFLQGDPYFHPLLTSDYDDYLHEPEPLRQFQAGHPLIARDSVRRILAVKLDHIGDFVTAFPAFRRLKSHFPNAELVVLAAEASLSLAELEPAIDRVIEFNFFHARSESGRRVLTRAELRALHRTLSPFRFDIALDLRRQTDTRDILRHTGARWLAGFDQDYACRWLDIAVEFEGDVSRQFKRSHVSDSLVHFIDTIAVACEPDRAGVRSPMARAQARQIAAGLPTVRDFAAGQAGLRLFDRPVVCVHAGAGAVNKQWPAASFAGLIDLLAGRAGAHIVIIGGPDEAAIADQVMGQVRRREQVFSLVGKTSLRDLPTLLLSADLYVGNDSGPKHMAASLGLPTIGIHSGSVDASEWGPMGTSTVTIRRDMTCGPCYIALAADCPRSLACLHGIAVGDVYRACERLLLLRQGHVD